MPVYDAFISYSHAKDKPIAAALQSAIQKLGKPWYRRRALRVFRDDTSLSATPHLWPSIEAALGQSRFMILLASLEAAASPWVSKEVAYWLDHNSVETLLIALTEGELKWDSEAKDLIWAADTPLPGLLKGKLGDEPRWIDLRAYRDGAATSNTGFIEVGAEFAATIRGTPKEDLLSQEVRQQRRALRLAWSAAALLLILTVVATGAGILAYRAQQEAIAQRNRAEQTLAAATTTAGELVFGLAQRLRNTVTIPASLVKDILDRARALQDQLVKSGQVTPDIKHLQAAALDETAQTLLAIGDTTGALAAAEQALQIAQELFAADPANVRWQLDLSTSYIRLGDIRVFTGDLVSALKWYQDSLAVARQLAQSDRGNASRQREVSTALNRIGDVQLEKGDPVAALKAYGEGLAIMDRLAQSDSRNILWQHDLSVSHAKVGDVQMIQRDFADAMQSYRNSLAIVMRLAQSEPGNSTWQRSLAFAYVKVGEAQEAQGNLADALQTYRDSLARRERLAQSDPENAEWQHDMSVALTRIGRVQLTQGDTAGALQSFQASFAIMRRLVQSNPRNTDWQQGLAASHAYLADVYRESNDTDKALAELRQGQAIMERLRKLSPENDDWKRYLGWFNDQIAKLTR